MGEGCGVRVGRGHNAVVSETVVVVFVFWSLIERRGSEVSMMGMQMIEGAGCVLCE